MATDAIVVMEDWTFTTLGGEEDHLSWAGGRPDAGINSSSSYKEELVRKAARQLTNDGAPICQSNLTVLLS